MPDTESTPGPWEISRHATPEWAPQFGIFADGRKNDIAIVRGDNAEADATLLAAAPDLLDQLGHLTECVRQAWDDPSQIRNEYWMKMLTRCEAAILKATGGE